MDLQEYRKDFIENVKATALNNSAGTIESFVNIAANNLVDMQVISDFEPCFYTGEGKRGRKIRIDGYYFDDYDLTMNLIAAVYDGSDSIKTLTKTEANQVFERIMNFIDETINGKLRERVEISRPEYDLIDILELNKERIRKYRCIIITDEIISERIESLPFDDYYGIPVEFHIWDIGRFFKIFSSEQAREKLEINFLDYTSEGIPCLEASNAVAKGYRCFLCVVPGSLVADLYDCYGSRLLEGNVRSFLSTKVAVNKKIRETILTNPSMFFAFNNGIAATATDVVVEEKVSGKYITYAKDLQIVNGGQTTASLSSTRYKDKAKLDNIYIQMKLTEIDTVLANDIIPQISRSSNSQNKVSEADFFSNHPFHIRIEQISRRLYAPAVGGAQHDTLWFYERTRGQYLQAQMKMTKSEKNKFLIQNPKSQVITKTDLAKYQNSWKCLPHIVSKGAQTNFIEFAESITKEWDNDNSKFNELFYQESVSLAILFHNVEKIVDVQPWYEKGYRANIVTYSIALLSYLLKKEYTDKMLDLQLIWNKQDIPEVLKDQMVILTKCVFDSITNPNRETMNVTQWCKRENCWDNVKSIKINLLDNIESILIDKSENKKMIHDAKKLQNVTSEMEIQMLVVKLGVDYWNNMISWGKKYRKISPEEIQLLLQTSKITIGKIPNPYQCNRIINIRERLISEGFNEK